MSGHLPQGAGWTTFWLSDEPSSIPGYKRLSQQQPTGPTKESITATIQGNGGGGAGNLVNLTDQPNGLQLKWISPSFAAAYNWLTWDKPDQFYFSTWGEGSHYDANAHFHISYWIYRNGVLIQPGNNFEASGVEPFPLQQDWYFRPSGWGKFETGDRLVYVLYLDGSLMKAGHTVKTFYNCAIPGEVGDTWISLPLGKNAPPVFVDETAPPLPPSMPEYKFAKFSIPSEQSQIDSLLENIGNQGYGQCLAPSQSRVFYCLRLKGSSAKYAWKKWRWINGQAERDALVTQIGKEGFSNVFAWNGYLRASSKSN